MLRFAAASFAVVVMLGWVGRLDADMAVPRSLKDRLRFGFDTLHSVIVNRNMGVLDAEPITAFPEDHPLAIRAKSIGLLQMEFGRSLWSCTATVIAADLVLTNRHCIVDGSTRPSGGTLNLDFLDSGLGEILEV